jgi:hypothetical protein
LARLDEDLSPLRASVDREGNLLRLQGPATERDLAAEVDRVLDELGYSAQLLTDSALVSRWFGAGETDELSQEEASVLAERWIHELSAEMKMPQRLSEPLRITLLETFRSAARTEIHEPHIEDAALRSVLDENEVQVVQQWLRRKLRRADPD